jgi:hypothetical protein
MIRRTSPLDMGLHPNEVVLRNGWPLVLTYREERVSCSVFITDLSHISQWSLQDGNLAAVRPADLEIPLRPREVAFERDILIVRLTPSECRIMVFGDEIPEFTGPGYTELTDAHAVFALVGPQCLEVLNKLSSVDLEAPDQAVPCAVQAPIEEVPCLIVRLKGEGTAPVGLIVSGARGYGHFLINIFMDAGQEYGIGVAGWQRFMNWLKA